MKQPAEHDGGRFTRDGSADLEARTRAVVQEVAAIVADRVPPRELVALVLVGGYGRGEGGVEVRDGVEVPHNNLDFVLVARAGSPRELRARVDPALQRVAAARGLGIDLAVFSARSLRHAEPLVLWVDMRHGHKTVLGDPDFVPSLRHLEVRRIRPWDVRNLLTNRATLLVINDLVLEAGVLTADDRRLVVRHVVKALIGAGDALLFFAGLYDPSYTAKQRSMRACPGVPERLRSLYDEAIEFRFRPAYADWVERDLRALCGEVRGLVSVAHRIVEGKRLGTSLPSWDGYLERALAHALTEDALSPRALARKVKNALAGAPTVAGLSAPARAGLHVVGLRGSLPLVFPAVAYDDAPTDLLARAAQLLHARPVRSSLARAYLRAWGAGVDTNFAHVAARHHIHLEEAPS